MEGEGGRDHSNAAGNRPGGQPLWAALDKQPVDLQAVLMGERAKRFDHFGSLHRNYDITTIVELSTGAARRHHGQGQAHIANDDGPLVRIRCYADALPTNVT